MLKFYEVNGKFIDFLRKYEPKIPYINSNQYKNYKNKKFFCGVVLDINGMNYFAPVSSYNKTNLVTFPIKDLSKINPVTNNPKQISSLRFSFMFPCPFNLITPKNFSKESVDYQNLLRKELNYCNSNISAIKKQAKSVYNLSLKTFSRNKYHLCDFRLLEEKCKEWEEVYTILPFLKYIKNEDDLFYIYDNLNDKNNFDRVVKMLDNNTLSKNITTMNIKDLENKRIPSVQEITTSVYEKIKDKKEVNFDDLLNDLETFLDLSGKFQDVFNDGKFIKPLSKQEIEDIKVRAFEYSKNLYGDEETDVQEENIDTPNLEDNDNNSNPPKEAEVEEIPKYEDTIYENKNAKVNEAGNVILEEKPIIEIPSKEDFWKNIYNIFSLIDEEYSNIDNWKLPKDTLIEEIENIFINSIDFFLDNYGDKNDTYLQYIPEEYKNMGLENDKILSNFLYDEIVNKFGTPEELVELNKKELERMEEATEAEAEEEDDEEEM